MYVDRDLWAKVVLNLLSNAMKFTFTGGITVRLTQDGDRVVLSVSDTGTGIPEHELPHLFERFHRVSGARSRTHEGSGIGLALVSELVALHGGTVAATSTPGEGSTFTAAVPFGSGHLPAEQIAAPTDGQSATLAAVAEGFLAEATHWVDGDTAVERAVAAVDAGPEKPRVLVVDDNADIREYVASLLSGDYLVQTAVDGADGARAGPRAAAGPGHHRRDDAADGRLRAARGAPGRPGHARHPRRDAVRAGR